MTSWSCATDTESVRVIGVHVWEAGPGWPTSDVLFDEICNALLVAYDSVRERLPEEQRLALDVLDVDRAIVARAIDLRIAGLETVRRNGRFLRRGSDFEPLPLAEDLFATRLGATWRSSGVADRILRRIAKRWVFNRQLSPLRRLAALTSGARSILIGSTSGLIAADLAARDAAVDAIPVETFLISPNQLPPQADAIAVDAFEAALREVDRKVSASTGYVLNVASLAPRLAMRLSEASAWISIAAQRLPKRMTTLYVGEIGKTPQRIVAAAAKLNGADVVTVNHGFYAGETALDDALGMQHLLSSRVVAYNSVNARRLKESYHASRAARLNLPHFTTAGTFDGMVGRMPIGSSVRPGPIRSVMIVGYPMNQIRYTQSAGHYFTFQLSAERTLARIFRSIGLKVIYKVHPERVAEASGLFDDCVDEVRGGRFEEQIDAVDSFAFASHLTTTFNVAIASGKPCLVLDIPGMRWSSGARETLSSAVRFVPAVFDELGHLRPVAGAVERAVLDETPIDLEPYLRAFMQEEAA